MFFSKWRQARRERKAEEKAFNEVVNEADDYMQNGKKVNAIKAIRAGTGWGLKEAKAWVDKRYGC